MHFFSLHIILLVFSTVYGASDELPKNLTEPEKLKFNDVYEMGRETEPPQHPVRNIAEYEPMLGVLIRYPFGLSIDIISEISSDDIVYCLVSSNLQSIAYSEMENGGVIMDNVEFILGQTDSYWTRDYGPWFVVDGQNNIAVSDFTYNRPRPNDNDAPSKIADYLSLSYYSSDIIHAGGNYMTDGLGTAASSDLVYQENLIPDTVVQNIMYEYFGIEEYHVVADPNNTYIDHIDCWGKYLSPTKILIREVPNSHPQFEDIEQTVEYFSSTMNYWGEPWEVFRVWTPNNEPYTNSLILNDKVFLPINGSNHDNLAIEAYENALPGYSIMGFSGSWESTDALHCRTKGIPDLQMLQLFHNPNNDGLEPDTNGYFIQIQVNDLSDAGIVTDSMKVFWRDDESSNWSQRHMQLSHTVGNSETWTGTIQAVTDTTIINYFIQAADSSGRVETSPPGGWHDFIAYPTNLCNDWMRGDLDNSNKKDLIDIILLSELLISNSIGLCPESKHVSDINDDGQITVVDILFLVNNIINP